MFSVQGPVARRVRDVRLGLDAMSAPDMRDPWWVPAPKRGPEPPRPIGVALAVDPARTGVDRSVADAVRRAGIALERAGYAVEEVEPPDVEAAAQLWWRIVMTEIRHMTEPTIRRLGDKGMNRALDVYLAAAPEVDLSGYIKGLAQRRTTSEIGCSFLSVTRWSSGRYRASHRCQSGLTPTPRPTGTDCGGSSA